MDTTGLVTRMPRLVNVSTLSGLLTRATTCPQSKRCMAIWQASRLVLSLEVAATKAAASLIPALRRSLADVPSPCTAFSPAARARLTCTRSVSNSLTSMPLLASRRASSRPMSSALITSTCIAFTPNRPASGEAHSPCTTTVPIMVIKTSPTKLSTP